MKAKQAVADSESIHMAPEEDTSPGFTMETELVIREKGRVQYSSQGNGTIGDMLDRQIADLAQHGGEMRNFSISFSKEDWEAAKKAYKGY